MNKINCINCGCTLYNDVNTFGETGQEMCWNCYSSINQLEYEQDEDYSYYGTAPHHHDLTRTGSYIGSTVFEPLPETSENGWYWIEKSQMWFWPDPEVEGAQGIWSSKKP